jgi:hypothetical protein
MEMTIPIQGISVPDSKLVREITEFVRYVETPLLFHHSSRVFYWRALTGKRRGLRFDPELLYAGAMFHDIGLTRRTRVRISASKWTAPISRATSCGAPKWLRPRRCWSGPKSASASSRSDWEQTPPRERLFLMQNTLPILDELLDILNSIPGEVRSRVASPFFYAALATKIRRRAPDGR